MELDGAPLEAVRSIIADVRARGDISLIELGQRFDGVAPETIEVSAESCRDALGRIDPALADSLRAAKESISAFHRADLAEPCSFSHNGIDIRGWRQPVERAGCYVPGGLGAYPSTVLMTAVIARAAGVDEVVVCVPPSDTGRISDVVLAACAIAEVDSVYAIGGAQAVAAMAYGTETVKPVDVIVGPGNKYVALAKREVSGVVGVPSAFAGPSEICVVADASANPDFVAIDLMVQAEHGPDGLSWLVTDSVEVLEAVEKSLVSLLAQAPRRADIEGNLERNGHVGLVKDMQAAVDVANAIAPEHLQFMVSDPEAVVPRVRNAGAVFVGSYAPASIGDYVAGPSHCLPTNGTARFGGALGVEDFTKLIHVIECGKEGLSWAAGHVEAIAEVENLPTHGESVRIRKQTLGNDSTKGNMSGVSEKGN